MSDELTQDPAPDDSAHRPPSLVTPPPLDTPAPLLDQLFDGDGLYALRAAVAAHATAAGLSEGRTADLVAAAHELAANAVRHGGGHGRLRLWNRQNALHCQVSDEGPAGDWDPDPDAAAQWGAQHGSGLWLVRQLADQMHLQTGRYGTIVTVTLTLGPPARRAEFTVRYDAPAGCSLLTVEGELDLRSAPEFAGAIAQALDGAATAGSRPRIVLDVTGVTFWDSSGIAALLTAQQKADTTPGAQMVLVGPAGMLRERLRTMGLTARFVWADSVDEAVRVLCG